MFYKLLIIIFLYALDAYAGDMWFNYTDGNHIVDVAVNGNDVWCATWGGAVQWDTKDMSFNIHTVIDGLSHNMVTVIEVDRQGHVWVGTDGGGACEYDGAQWIHHGYNNGLKSTTILAFAFGDDDTVYAAGYGIWRYCESKWEELTDPDSYLLCSSVCVDQQGQIWAAYGGGMNYYDIDYYSGTPIIDGPEWVSLPLPDDLPDKTIRKTGVNGDEFWMGSLDGLALYKNDEWTVYTDIGSTITDITPARDGVTWFSTGIRYPGVGGIWRFDGNSWEYYMLYNSFYGIDVDENNAVWTGYRRGVDNKLCKMYDGSWEFFQTNIALHDKMVLTVHESLSKDIYFGTRYGLSRYRDGIWSVVFYGSSGNESCKLITTGPDGNLYLAKSIEGLYCLDNYELIQVGDEKPQYIISLAFAPNGDIYAGLSHSPMTEGGLVVYNGEEWYEIPELHAHDVHALTFDTEGTLWTGSGGGLKHRIGSEWTTYSADDLGIPQNFSDRDSYFVTSLASDSNGCVYVGTDLGLYKISGDVSEMLYRDDICDEIRTVMVDHKDRVWCARHIQRQDGWREDRVGCYTNGEYTEYEIPDNDMLTEINCIEVTLSGEVWIGTGDGGMFRLIPDEITSVETQDAHPEALLLGAAFPNPFNASVTIPFYVPESGNVGLWIYGLNGQKVRTLKDEYVHAGSHSVKWNGCNDSGEPVASGMYFIHLKTRNVTESGKILFLK